MLSMYVKISQKKRTWMQRDLYSSKKIYTNPKRRIIIKTNSYQCKETNNHQNKRAKENFKKDTKETYKGDLPTTRYMWRTWGPNRLKAARSSRCWSCWPFDHARRVRLRCSSATKIECAWSARCNTGHNTLQHNTLQHNTLQHNTLQHNTLQHNTLQHNTLQHNTLQHNTLQHNT